MSIGTVVAALGLLKDLAPSIGNVAQRFLDGKATSEELKAEAAKHELSAEVQLALAQVQLNSNEAQHSSIFVAGWRPMVGWICALAMGFNFLIVPILMAIGLDFTPLDISLMMPVLLGMLGIGGMRSFEKTKGVHRDTMRPKPRLEDF